MSDESASKIFDFGAIFRRVQSELEKKGVSVEWMGEASGCCDPGEEGRIKVVCMAPGLRASVEELGKSPRDQVVMVRVDADTSAELDAWVETGAVKSRSEAAALFIREGLKIRSDELSRLRDAIEEVEQARERLRRRVEEVFDHGEAPAEPTTEG